MDNEPRKDSCPETLIRNLLDIASKGGNFLLNAGPTNLGEFPQESVDILQKMGQWMKINGEAVYGTNVSPWGLFSWGRCTRKAIKDNTVLYFSVFEWPADGKLVIPELKNKVVSALLLADGTKLKTSASIENTTIVLPSKAPDPIATVIKITVRGKIVVTPVLETKK